ncbi:pantetheine-phosphate adenylyltransferase [Salinirubellus sp. GCM10025818]|uniref:pantetheine-phosphate adenylyltransferase n=1 Tax=Salinirubellus TaxID=2162630 RepID=UPI0030D52891
MDVLADSQQPSRLPAQGFQTASQDGDGHVIIGITPTGLAKQTRSDPAHVELIEPFEKRRSNLETELDRMKGAYTASYEVIRLKDLDGPAATREDVGALVASPETKAQHRVYELNRRRRDAGLPPLEVHIPPFVVVEDNERISSTRIRNGEIDIHGRVLDPSDRTE